MVALIVSAMPPLVLSFCRFVVLSFCRFIVLSLAGWRLLCRPWTDPAFVDTFRYGVAPKAAG
ncbi:MULTISPECIES: hypothetical protein, partial [unclassified Wenzhouxiangella]|uniref:hypothetical protein n=1 Tax=unclassified Wenzhouxiangella TaxID=2613841 RepID=UPI001C6F0394